ncbi:uncharacterized protein LOC117178059 isoform X2 [Belonocnema kinseyi]|nr:uncharacterized protein LOC117178059 isoform X2 [Belonocnema kinseyi]XP_033225162.1 uncharacterized protein LOC117178059 isoform X2 [Belonocnema kinseyi]XP_033225163.1 uncharacterized protein LOC117178059 isoform X2 [Belonocnema kinseyi]
MVTSKAIMFLILGILFLTTAQNIDDSDYNPVEIDKEYPLIYSENFKKSSPTDDFYVLNEIEEVENDPETHPRMIEKFQAAKNQNTAYSTGDKIEKIFFKKVDSITRARSPPQNNFYKKIEEKIYRYTKHRMPGYDYDEFNIFGDSRDEKCNEKSTWTHCLCQFTCYEPSTVDCYSPCESGCECKEDFVFDERTKQCLLPSQCESGVDYFYDYQI